MGLILESSSLEWLSIAIIFFTYVYYHFTSAYNYWKKKGVKYMPPEIPFGNMKDVMLLRKSGGVHFKDVYAKYPNEPYIGMYQFASPILLLRDPDLIKNVLVKDFAYFQNRDVTKFDEKRDPLTMHLLNLKGQKWRILRAKLSPTFTSGKMKMMFHIMTECSDQLKEYLSEPAERGDIIEMKEVLSKFTTDVIGSCAFGLQFNSIKDSNSEFRNMGRRVFEPSAWSVLRRTIRTLAPGLLKLFNVKMLPEDITQFFVGLVRDTIEYREKNNVVRNDFMQLLIQMKNQGKVQDEEHTNSENISNETGVNGVSKNDELEFTDNVLASQAFIFFLAGFETSSTTLSFCLYELSLNPDIQAKLRDEIDATLEKCNGKITYDAVQGMRYLDKVVNETLRKHPPAPAVTRVVTKPYVIPDTSVPLEMGTMLFIPIYGLHHDPKYFPNPERFNPENFSEEAKNSRPNIAFIPFGEGPRNCIGLRFGLLQTKMGLVCLLANYQFDVCEKTQIPLKFDPRQIILTSTAGTWLKISKR